MTDLEIQKWQRIRTQGKARFILRSGLLRAGVPFAIYMLAMSAGYNALTHHPVAPVADLVRDFLIFVGTFGYGMGLTAWHRREREFLQATGPAL